MRGCTRHTRIQVYLVERYGGLFKVFLSIRKIKIKKTNNRDIAIIKSEIISTENNTVISGILYYLRELYTYIYTRIKYSRSARKYFISRNNVPFGVLIYLRVQVLI